MWRKLFDQCEHIETAYDGYKFAPKPTAVLLDQFEKTRGLSLPTSYRQFVTMFGPGELAGLYRIAAPMPIPTGHGLAAFDRNLPGEPDDRLLETFGPQEVTGKLVFFGASGGGDFFGWMTDEETDRKANEYAIYRFDFAPMKRICKSFEDWVKNYVMKANRARRWTPEYKFSRFQVEA